MTLVYGEVRAIANHLLQRERAEYTLVETWYTRLLIGNLITGLRTQFHWWWVVEPRWYVTLQPRRSVIGQDAVPIRRKWMGGRRVVVRCWNLLLAR